MLEHRFELEPYKESGCCHSHNVVSFENNMTEPGLIQLVSTLK